jgi:GTP1/Obg family GTP-binding protein
MKLIILIFVASIIAFIMGVSTMAKINTNHNEKMFTELHNEHCVIMDKINKIDEKCDGIARIEQLIRQNMSAPYTNDR